MLEADRDRQPAMVDVIGGEDDARAEQSDEQPRERQHRQRAGQRSQTSSS